MGSERYLRDNRNCKRVNFSFSGKSWWMSKVFLITIENERVAQYRCWVISIEARLLVFTQVIIRQNVYCKNEHIETTNYTYTGQVCTENSVLRSNFDGHFIPTSWMIFFPTQFSPVHPRGPKVIFIKDPVLALQWCLNLNKKKGSCIRCLTQDPFSKQPCCSLICLSQIGSVHICHRSHQFCHPVQSFCGYSWVAG